MQRQRERSGPDHESITDAQLPHLLSEEVPLADRQWVARVFIVTQHRGQHHDGEADPEQHKEAAEVMVLARGVEMGDAIDVLDGREHALLLLRADLASRRRGGLH